MKQQGNKRSNNNYAGVPIEYTPQQKVIYKANNKYNLDLTREEINQLESLALDYQINADNLAKLIYDFSTNQIDNKILKGLDNYTALSYLFIIKGKN